VHVSASQGRRWQGRRPTHSTSECEAEDAASGVIWPARHVRLTCERQH
jgi:hypothetical protein